MVRTACVCVYIYMRCLFKSRWQLFRTAGEPNILQASGCDPSIFKGIVLYVIRTFLITCIWAFIRGTSIISQTLHFIPMRNERSKFAIDE